MEQTHTGADHGHESPALDNRIIHLTVKAVEMVKDAMSKENLPEHLLRVAVVGGGCSGYQYGLDFDKEAGEDDLEFEQDGVRIVIDQYSANYLKGTQIDYVVGLSGAGFKFINPNAQRTCGCGSSFSG